MIKDFKVLIDSREQNPWSFYEEVKRPGKFRCLGSEVIGLKSGDYSISVDGKSFENEIVIEKKSGFCELFGNYTPKENNERFLREMERIKEVKYKYLVIETNLSHDLFGLTIPQIKFGPPGSKIFEWIIDLQQEYGIVPIFAGQCGQKVVRKIFEQFLKNV